MASLSEPAKRAGFTDAAHVRPSQKAAHEAWRKADLQRARSRHARMHLEECNACIGTGTDEDEQPCEECDGTGFFQRGGDPPEE